MGTETNKVYSSSHQRFVLIFIDFRYSLLFLIIWYQRLITINQTIYYSNKPRHMCIVKTNYILLREWRVTGAAIHFESSVIILQLRFLNRFMCSKNPLAKKTKKKKN